MNEHGEMFWVDEMPEGFYVAEETRVPVVDGMGLIKYVTIPLYCEIGEKPSSTVMAEYRYRNVMIASLAEAKYARRSKKHEKKH